MTNETKQPDKRTPEQIATDNIDLLEREWKEYGLDNVEKAIALLRENKIEYPIYLSNELGNWRIDSESSEPVLLDEEGKVM